MGEVFGLGDVITPREEVRYANNSLNVLTGTLFLFLGFKRIGYELRRHVIGGVGVLYVLSGAVSIVGKLFVELSLEFYALGYDFERVGIGVLCVLVAKFLFPREHVDESEVAWSPSTVAAPPAKEDDAHELK